MKRILSVLIGLVLAGFLPAAASAAAAGDITLTYDLTSGGKHDITVKTGEVITVTYRLSASERCRVSTTQNEIYYDSGFFEFVEGSDEAGSGGTGYETGSRPPRLDGSHYVFFNTGVTHEHDTPPAEIGTFRLKVIAAGGETVVENRRCKAADENAVHFAAETRDLKVRVDNAQEKIFLLTFLREDGTEFKTVPVKEGGSVTLPTGPAKAGCTFSHWSIAGDAAQYPAGRIYTPGSDVTFLPNWTPNGSGGGSGGSGGSGGGTGSCTLTFETNGGSGIPKISDPAGSVIDLRGYAPAREGSAFAGWYGDAALTNPIASVKLTGDMTVYAKWAEKGGSDFKDIPDGAYYEEAVRWASGRGIAKGISTSSFGPDIPCTRAQMAAFLWRASGCPAAAGRTCTFTDVESGAYYYEALLWAVETGITKGVTATAFAPNAACTRGQVVTFLYRCAGAPEVRGENPFTDVSENDFCYDAVLWAYREGITRGAAETAFRPGDGCTRAQIVTFLYRFLG